ncbi:hypothetical protein [Actinomadura macrotermitis]|uniref:Uncharacterized protein n=1 Tax=Actinomadura macrotermitis TaxID=2585200 RepID=A0A7K0BU31_9ACTN|nr:hypothetical protein [Actinomadura macrotermitis]MQY04546.1 hypothetical protein [Actinomadura macrotermitis]
MRVRLARQDRAGLRQARGDRAAGLRVLVDIDPRQSEATRRALLASLADTGTLVLGTHFAPPAAGRVVTHGGAYRLAPVDPR